jgi:AraC-like DNA-binding protein
VHYREFQPAPALQHVVECYWTMEGAATQQRIVPDGRPELIVNLEEPFERFENGAWTRQPRSFFAGQIDKAMLVRPTGRARMLGVRFKPWGASGIFRPGMRELASQTIPLADLAPSLVGAEDLAAIERVLMKLARLRDLLVETLAEKIVATRLRDLRSLTNLSLRQLERRFVDAIGLTPKTFARIQRFQKVLRAMEAPGARWIDAAVDCGYYDQAHLVRDFRDFSGDAPSSLLKESSDLARHFVSHSSKTNPAELL